MLPGTVSHVRFAVFVVTGPSLSCLLRPFCNEARVSQRCKGPPVACGGIRWQEFFVRVLAWCLRTLAADCGERLLCQLSRSPCPLSVLSVSRRNMGVLDLRTCRAEDDVPPPRRPQTSIRPEGPEIAPARESARTTRCGWCPGGALCQVGPPSDHSGAHGKGMDALHHPQSSVVPAQ